jgi:hypothetical protein
MWLCSGTGYEVVDSERVRGRLPEVRHEDRRIESKRWDAQALWRYSKHLPAQALRMLPLELDDPPAAQEPSSKA